MHRERACPLELLAKNIAERAIRDRPYDSAGAVPREESSKRHSEHRNERRSGNVQSGDKLRKQQHSGPIAQEGILYDAHNSRAQEKYGRPVSEPIDRVGGRVGTK